MQSIFCVKWQVYNRNISQMCNAIVFVLISSGSAKCEIHNRIAQSNRRNSISHHRIVFFSYRLTISRDQFDMLALRWMFLWIILLSISVFNFLHEQRWSCGVCIWRYDVNGKVFRQMRMEMYRFKYKTLFCTYFFSYTMNNYVEGRT